VSDILTRRAWNTLHVMTLEQSHALKEAFNKAADETGYVSWLKCMQIAKDLDLEYEQVCSRCECDFLETHDWPARGCKKRLNSVMYYIDLHDRAGICMTYLLLLHS